MSSAVGDYEYSPDNKKPKPELQPVDVVVAADDNLEIDLFPELLDTLKAKGYSYATYPITTTRTGWQNSIAQKAMYYIYLSNCTGKIVGMNGTKLAPVGGERTTILEAISKLPNK